MATETLRKKYLEYPGVSNLLEKAKAKQKAGHKLIFHSLATNLHDLYSLESYLDAKASLENSNWNKKFKYLLESPVLNRISLSYSGFLARALVSQGAHEEILRYASESKLGLLGTQSNSLLSKSIGGLKVLDAFSFAYVEARASHYYRKEFFKENKLVDYFWCPDGLSNMELFAEVLKAHNFSKEDIAVLAVPKNAFKAFKEGKFADWVEVESTKEKISDSKFYQFDKTGNKVSELELGRDVYGNLNSPLYKTRAGEYWVVLVPISEGDLLNYGLGIAENPETYSKAALARTIGRESEEGVSFCLDYQRASTLLSNGLDSVEEIEQAMNYELPAEGVISASVGQAARVIFELMGGFEEIPEALLYADGGSCSSVVTEKNSDGRHVGAHNMHQVVRCGWHLMDDVLIPWNYLSFDQLCEGNKQLLESDDVFFLSPDEDSTRSLMDKKVFLEAPQNWKIAVNELLSHVIKFVYKEFWRVASRKYYLNLKDTVELVSKYLGTLAIYPEQIAESAREYKSGLKKLNAPEELHDYLRAISYLHLAADSMLDYYSSKIHPLALLRLKYLAKAHRILKDMDLWPESLPKFEAELRDIVSQDEETEFTTIENLYFSELNKLSS